MPMYLQVFEYTMEMFHHPFYLFFISLKREGWKGSFPVLFLCHIWSFTDSVY